MLSACGSHYAYKFKKDKHGVIIFQDSLTLQINVVNPSIIHVKKILNNKEIILLMEKLKSRKIGKILH